MPLYTMSTSGSAEKVSDVAGSFPVPNGTAVLNERLKGSQLHTALKSEPFASYSSTCTSLPKLRMRRS